MDDYDITQDELDAAAIADQLVAQPFRDEIERLSAALAAERDLRAEWQALAADECSKASAATKARQAAQTECEALKDRLARAGLEQQRAVIAERERCALICDSLGGGIDPRDPDETKLCANSLAWEIRGRPME